MEKLEEKLKRISAWWNREYTGRPLLNVSINTEDSPPQAVNLNELWQSPEIEPDFEKMVAVQIENIFSHYYLAESYPALPHSWGRRGTPMTMAAYLGGKVVFREETVWFEPVIENWEKFNIQFDKENYWVKISKKLIEEQIKRYDGTFLIWLPDFGDALTVFSLLRGVENLLIDLVEKPDIIKEKVKDFTKVWIETHNYFYSLYVEKKLPGDCCWLTWAPGKTYACQCDFSTMISPKMFEEFVVPEIEELGKYLDFIVWHLDGHDEIKHLDTLLNMSEIKAIQIVPGAGNPPCASDLWLPQMKKIQEKEKLVFAYASTREEVETLVKNLSPEKLSIGCDLPFVDVNKATDFINWVESISKLPRPRNG